MNDIDDPLWNPAAKADGDLVRIEQLLSPLGARARARGITMPTVRTHQPRHLRGLGWAMAAAVTLMVSAGAFQYRLRWQEGAGWQASRTTAASTTNSRLDPGHRIVTRPDQTARISVARIGNISLSPDSSLRLERTGTGQHRVRLDSGHMRARIWAPPGYFGVETGSAEIVASMRDNVYESITLKLGDGCTVDEIAGEYNANKSFYDNLKDNEIQTLQDNRYHEKD